MSGHRNLTHDELDELHAGASATAQRAVISGLLEQHPDTGRVAHGCDACAGDRRIL